ncbi:hypothetical protein ACE102_33845 [Bradyrhizobium sp. vgs-9]|uniref:hypothetical protein n=1 Tax=Bradyrhizobium sp. vgs-9 TaxID=208389 RepID=UPI0035D411D2
MATPNLVLPTTRSTIARQHKSTAKGNLGALIEKLNAAATDVGKWCTIEEQLDAQFRKAAGPAPKVKGGATLGSQLFREGQPVFDMPASDWFYHSREAIEKDQSKALADVEGAEDRAKIKARFAALLADWDAQETKYNLAKPRGLAHAKRMLNKAHSAWTAAEDEIVNYRPRSLEEAIELMAYAGRDEMRSVFFTPEEGQLKFMMRNIGAALAEINTRAG